MDVKQNSLMLKFDGELELDFSKEQVISAVADKVKYHGVDFFCN